MDEGQRVLCKSLRYLGAPYLGVVLIRVALFKALY